MPGKIRSLGFLLSLTALLAMPVLQPAQVQGEMSRIGAVESLLSLYSGNLKQHNDEYLQSLITGLEEGRLRYKVRADGVWLIEGADGSHREYSIVLREEIGRDGRFAIGTHENATALLFRLNSPSVPREVTVGFEDILDAMRRIKSNRKSIAAAQEKYMSSKIRGHEEQALQAQVQPTERVRAEMELRAILSARSLERFSEQKMAKDIFSPAALQEPLDDSVVDTPRGGAGSNILLGGSGSDTLTTDNNGKGGFSPGRKIKPSDSAAAAAEQKVPPPDGCDPRSPKRECLFSKHTF